MTPEFDYEDTSAGKIAAALEAGTIDLPTSLLYRVYAAFGSAELPAEYRSEIVDLHEATFAFSEIAAHDEQMPAEIKAALAPYLARPNDPSSVFSQPPPLAAVGLSAQGPRWVSTPAAGGKARVWVAQGEAAEALDYYVSEVDQVWPKVFSLTREPIPDAPHEPLASVNPDNAIDIYFVDVGRIDPRILRCHSEPTGKGCSQLGSQGGYTQDARPRAGRTSSAYVVIDVAARGERVAANIAHELMHTSQFSYDRHESVWLLDSSAEWGSFRTLQMLGLIPSDAHGYLGEFFAGLDEPVTRDEGKNRYASWLYFLSLQADYGDSVARTVFERMAADGEQGPAAVDDAYRFEANFGPFAVRNWNRDTADRYREVDERFPADLHPALDYRATMPPGDEQLKFETASLSSDYAAFTFTDDVRQVNFDNPFTSVVAECQCIPSVWLIAKAGGSWKLPQEIKGERQYCFARPDEDLDELVVIVANTGWQGGTPLNAEQMPTINASDEECELADVEGTLTWTAHGTYHDSGGGLTHNENSQEQITISVRMNESEDGFADAGSSFVWTGHATRTETSSLCTITLDTEYEGAGLFADHAADGASIGLRDDGGGMWTLSTVVAGTMHFTNSWTHVDCEITPGGEQPTPQFAGCDSEAVDMSQAATDGAIGTVSTDGRTINFACEMTVTETRQDPPGQGTHTVTMNGTLYLTTRGPALP